MTQDSSPPQAQTKEPLHSSDGKDNQRFEQLFDELTNGFGEACERQSVSTALAIAIHPNEKHPIIFMRGHKYDVAIILAKVLKSLKAEMQEELNTDYDMDYSNND